MNLQRTTPNMSLTIVIDMDFQYNTIYIICFTMCFKMLGLYH